MLCFCHVLLINQSSVVDKAVIYFAADALKSLPAKTLQCTELKQKSTFQQHLSLKIKCGEYTVFLFILSGGHFSTLQKMEAWQINTDKAESGLAFWPSLSECSQFSLLLSGDLSVFPSFFRCYLGCREVRKWEGGGEDEEGEKRRN